MQMNDWTRTYIRMVLRKPPRYVLDGFATVVNVRRFPGKRWKVAVALEGEIKTLRLRANARRLLKRAKRTKGNDFDVRLVRDRLYGEITVGGVEGITHKWHYLAGCDPVVTVGKAA